MGLTLQFAVGDKQQIIDAVKRFDFDFLDQLESENKMADFSLHIEPNDLNFLVGSAAELINIGEFGLRECLDTTKFYFDSEEGGAYFVDTTIIHLFSRFNENDARNITHKWFQKMTAEYEQDTPVNDDAIQAVEALIAISKDAQEQNLDLVHIWYP